MPLTHYVVAYSPGSPGIAHAAPQGQGAEAVCGVFAPDVREQAPFPPTPTAGAPAACRSCMKGIERIEAQLRERASEG